MARCVEPPMIMNSTKSKAVISPSVRRPEMRRIAHSTKKTIAALMTLSMARASGIDEDPDGRRRAGIDGGVEAAGAVSARMRPQHDAARRAGLRGESQRN